MVRMRPQPRLQPRQLAVQLPMELRHPQGQDRQRRKGRMQTRGMSQKRERQVQPWTGHCTKKLFSHKHTSRAVP
jgi:hypothetical protein